MSNSKKENLFANLAKQQTPMIHEEPAAPVVTADTTDDDSSDDGDPGGRRFLFGVAGGALNYDAGRSEQALGAVMRWVPAPWISLSANSICSGGR